MTKNKRFKPKNKKKVKKDLDLEAIGFTAETCKSCGAPWYRYRGPGDDGKYKDCWDCAAK